MSAIDIVVQSRTHNPIRFGNELQRKMSFSTIVRDLTLIKSYLEATEFSKNRTSVQFVQKIDILITYLLRESYHETLDDTTLLKPLFNRIKELKNADPALNTSNESVLFIFKKICSYAAKMALQDKPGRAKEILLELLKISPHNHVLCLCLFLEAIPLTSDVTEIMSYLHGKSIKIIHNNEDIFLFRIGTCPSLSKESGFHLINYLNRYLYKDSDPTSGKHYKYGEDHWMSAKDFLHFEAFPSYAERYPEVAITHFPQALRYHLKMIQQKKYVADNFHSMNVDSPRYIELVQRCLRSVPCALFKAVIHDKVPVRFAAEEADETQLSDVQHTLMTKDYLITNILNIFATRPAHEFDYNMYAEYLLSRSAELSIAPETVITLVSYSRSSQLTEKECFLFKQLLSTEVLQKLPRLFWKSNHITSLLDIIKECKFQITKEVQVEQEYAFISKIIFHGKKILELFFLKDSE